MKVFVVYDPLYEKIISVHKSENNADKIALEENKKENRIEKGSCIIESFEFELED